MAQAPQVLPGVPDLWHAALQMDEPAALRLEIRPGVPLQSLDDFYSWEDEESVQARSLLHLAALLNASSCAKALLHAGASPNLRSPTDGKTPVHCACINAGSPQGAVLLASLLRNGGDIATVEDFNGLRPSDILAQPHLYQVRSGCHCPQDHPGNAVGVFTKFLIILAVQVKQWREPLPKAHDEKTTTDEFRMYSFKASTTACLCPPHRLVKHSSLMGHDTLYVI